MKYSKWIIASVVALPMVTATAYAQEKTEHGQTVKLEDLPGAVKKTVQKEAKGKQIESIEKESENGKTTYEIELLSNGKGQEIKVSESGKVLKREPAHDEQSESEHGERMP